MRGGPGAAPSRWLLSLRCGQCGREVGDPGVGTGRRHEPCVARCWATSEHCHDGEGKGGGGGRAEKFLLHDGCNNTMSCGRDLGFSSDRVGGRKKRTRHGGKETRETEDGLRCLAMHHLCLPLRPYARFTYTPFWWARTMRLTPQAYLGNKRARHYRASPPDAQTGDLRPPSQCDGGNAIPPVVADDDEAFAGQNDETRRGRLCLESLACDILPFGAGETSGHDRPLARPPIPSWRDRWPERGNLPPPTAGLLTPGPR